MVRDEGLTDAERRPRHAGFFPSAELRTAKLALLRVTVLRKTPLDIGRVPAKIAVADRIV